MVAKREMPLGGRRAKMGTGRARTRTLGVMVDDARFEQLTKLAEVEGVTRTALIERWIDEHAVPVAESAAPPAE